MTAFYRGLADQGYAERRNLIIEYRWADGRYDRLPALALDLVRRNVAVIYAGGGTPVARAAKVATTTIPIVFSTGGNPVALGLVTSLSRPGGNATGVTALTGDLIAKRIETLHAAVPMARRIAFLTSPESFVANAETDQAQQATKVLGLDLIILNAGTPNEIEDAFTVFSQQHSDALVVGGDPLFRLGQRDHIAALAARHGIPAIYPSRANVAVGGLMSYGGNATETTRLAGNYVGRILNGEKPSDLPVQQVTKVELALKYSLEPLGGGQVVIGLKRVK